MERMRQGLQRMRPYAGTYICVVGSNRLTFRIDGPYYASVTPFHSSTKEFRPGHSDPVFPFLKEYLSVSSTMVVMGVMNTTNNRPTIEYDLNLHTMKLFGLLVGQRYSDVPCETLSSGGQPQ
jgi:hypothetical protein